MSFDYTTPGRPAHPPEHGPNTYKNYPAGVRGGVLDTDGVAMI